MIAGEDTNRFKYTNITATGTGAASLLKSSPGVLNCFTINGAPSQACTVNLYDNATTNAAPLIATITVTSGAQVQSLFYEASFNNGLNYSITSTGTVNFTISWI